MADNNTKVDFKRSAELLHIVEKCAGHGPKLNAIASAAMAELLELNDQLKEAALKVERKLQADRATAEATAKAQQEADARAEEERISPRLPLRPTTSTDPARTIASQPYMSPSEEPDIRPSVYPQDSNTATIADRRV